MAGKTQQLADIIEPAVAAVGYVLWGIEYVMQGKHSVLRVYIDHENGITVEDCEVVSRQVSAVLDVEDPIKSNYTLEVSSPGMDRPLFQPPQYRHFCGETIHCRVHQNIVGRKKFTGTLLAVTDEGIELEVDNETVDILFQDIDKANLVPQF